MITGKIKPTVTYEPLEKRFRIFPVDPVKFRIGNALRAVKTTHVSWREIAKFCGLADQTVAFRVAYVSKTFAVKRSLSEYLTFEGDTAYLYHHDHKPASATEIHVPVTVANQTPRSYEITERVPVKLAGRVTLTDPLERQLTMRITPLNGYVLGASDINLCNPNQSVTVNGTAKVLNNKLHSLYFVGWQPGDAQLEIIIDDNGGNNDSVTTVTIEAEVVHGETISIPEITMPESINGEAGKEVKLPAIKITDEDGKLLELQVTPFGCEVFGFKNYLHVIPSGEVRLITGRPDVVSADVANLTVRIPEDAKRAALGVQIVCKKTVISKYLIINLNGSEEPEEPEETEAKADEARADETTLTE